VPNVAAAAEAPATGETLHLSWRSDAIVLLPPG
jgi:hypothetical protein